MIRSNNVRNGRFICMFGEQYLYVCMIIVLKNQCDCYIAQLYINFIVDIHYDVRYKKITKQLLDW